MNGPSFSQMQNELCQADLAGLPRLRVLVLHNVTLDPMRTHLRHGLWKMGFDGQIDFGAYDHIFQETVGRQGELLSQGFDAIVVVARLEGLSWELARNFAALSAERVAEESHRVREYFASVLGAIRRQTSSSVFWCGLERPMWPALGAADAQLPAGQTAVVDSLNAALKESLRAHVGCYFVDLDLCAARVGAAGFYDARTWHIARAPYSLRGMAEIAAELLKFFRPLRGRQKKCLVLDCDNVLWGGIVGEDGPAGIRIAAAYPGSGYREFQQEVLNLLHRGVAVALCSKNNPADVMEVLEKHPDMLLRPRHIAALRVNWQDKATNLREIAAELNIGLESLVFMDDSEFEISLVRRALPEVEAIHLPPEQSVRYRDILASCGLFDAPALTDEDRRRGEMYAAEAQRRQARESMGLEEYLRSLEMELTVEAADAASLSRVAQLTQRTNQFNLTTVRRSESEVGELARSPDHRVLSLRVRDRFGDYGLVGACILARRAEAAEIDSFLLSCRVLGRGIEEAFLDCCVRAARQLGGGVRAKYVRSGKNAQVAEFYERQGFEVIHKTEDEKIYRLPAHGLPEVRVERFKRVHDRALT